MDCQGAVGRVSGCGMTRDDAKAERLAAALRTNLRRRKAQARGAEDDALAQTPVPEDQGSVQEGKGVRTDPDRIEGGE